MKSSKRIYFLVAIMILICSCFTSLSFSYFIPSTTNNEFILNSGLIDNSIEYDKIILNPNEERDIEVKVKSNNDFETNFKLYSKDTLKYITDDKTFDRLNNYEEKIIRLKVINESDEIKEINLSIKSSLVDEKIELKENELGI